MVTHLDILLIRWLEKFLKAFRGPVLVISHDHRFLDNVATHILDIDYLAVTGYPGNYARFLTAKADVARGDRLAIVGPNGIGKSTLLKVVIGELDADEGTARWGYEAHPGYFAQDPGDHLEAVRAYPGTLVFVSHDRWFVARLANRIVEITEEGITDYRGTYEEYVHTRGDDHLDVDTVVLRAREEKRKGRDGEGGRGRAGARGALRMSAWQRRRLEERAGCVEKVAGWMVEWEGVEGELGEG